MKPASYIAKKITSLTTSASGTCWSAPILNEMVNDVLNLLDAAQNAGRIKVVDERAMDRATFVILDRYY